MADHVLGASVRGNTITRTGSRTTSVTREQPLEPSDWSLWGLEPSGAAYRMYGRRTLVQHHSYEGRGARLMPVVHAGSPRGKSVTRATSGNDCVRPGTLVFQSVGDF